MGFFDSLTRVAAFGVGGALALGQTGGHSGGPGGRPKGGYAGPSGGFGGLEYDPITTPNAPAGFPAGLQGSTGFSAVARSILQGSAGAERYTRSGYEALLAHRLGGISGAQSEYRRRLGYMESSDGLSPDAARRMIAERSANAVGEFGSVMGQTLSERDQSLGELYKGTATELAGLKRDEINLAFQAYLARKARKSNQQAAMIGAAGELGGAALGAALA